MDRISWFTVGMITATVLAWVSASVVGVVMCSVGRGSEDTRPTLAVCSVLLVASFASFVVTELCRERENS